MEFWDVVKKECWYTTAGGPSGPLQSQTTTFKRKNLLDRNGMVQRLNAFVICSSISIIFFSDLLILPLVLLIILYYVCSGDVAIWGILKHQQPLQSPLDELLPELLFFSGKHEISETRDLIWANFVSDQIPSQICNFLLAKTRPLSSHPAIETPCHQPWPVPIEM